MKTLVILSHPDIENSNSNKAIIEYLNSNVEDIEIRHLEALYPDYKINVEAEQKALTEAEYIIFQHPFYWYSMPAMLKKYIDDIFIWGFAFGEGGDKLKGKQFIQSITVGGPQESYNAMGYNHFRIEEFLKPMEQTVYLSQMQYNLPIYSHRNFYHEGVWNSISEVKENAEHHAQRIVQAIETFKKGNSEKVTQFIKKWFQHFDALDENGFFIQYLSKEVQLQFSEKGNLTGYEGFNAWYNEIQENLLAPTSQVQDLEIKETQKNLFEIHFKLHLSATHKHTQETIDTLITEEWQLTWDDNSNRPVINSLLTHK